MKNVPIPRITRKSVESQKISQGPSVETTAEIQLGDCREQQEMRKEASSAEGVCRKERGVVPTQCRQKRLDEQNPRGSWAHRGKAALICSLGQLHSGAKGRVFIYLSPPTSGCAFTSVGFKEQSFSVNFT